MAEICPVCGLPKDLCVCGEMEKEQQRIRIRLEVRKWGKTMTIIDGIDSKKMKLSKLAAKLKSKCACGGTAKNQKILLQGDHREAVREILIELGFPAENIEVQ
ncbi:translation initiation factor [Candidatus Bathyarchaeota archaeon]|nr:translation initiation factor [Candidatus Bathyarchaeota archaeon]